MHSRITERVTKSRVSARCCLLATLLLGFGVAPHTAYADIYMYIDARGISHYSGHRLNSKFKLIAKGVSCGKQHSCGKKSEKRRRSLSKYLLAKQRQYSQLVNEVARKHDLKPALLHAVITVESAYNPKAVSHAGAIGMMQLMPATAKRFGVNDPYDPKQNIAGGTRYLRFLIKDFDGDLKLALAAYNAGEGAVKRYGNKIPPYKETRHYVRKVLRYYKKYRRRS